MADREFTLLALHFHNHGDVSLSPGIRTGGGESPVGELFGGETESTAGEESEGGGRRLPVVALAVVVVAGVAAAALKRRQLGEDEPESKRRIPPT